MIVVIVVGYLFTKGCFTSEPVKDRYNTHNPLQLEKANKWVETVIKIQSLKTVRIEAYSKDWDYYEVNKVGVALHGDDLSRDSTKRRRLSSNSMSILLGISDTLLINLIQEFDELGLNRFYREDNFFAFETETYLGYSKGYFFFIDPSHVKQKGDTLDFRNLKHLNNFKDGYHNRYLVLNNYDNHWLDWEQIK